MAFTCQLKNRFFKKFLICLFLCTVFISLPCFFKRGIGVVDDTNFLVISKWIGYGYKPYRDLIEIKPPAIFYTLHIIQKIFGEAWWISRAFILIIDITFVIFTALFVSKIYGSISGILTAVFLYPSILIFGGYRIHTETFVSLLGIIAINFIYNREKGSFIRIIGFGLIIGLASLYKQPGVFYLFGYIVFLLFEFFKKRINPREWLKFCLFSCIGFLLVWTVAIFLLKKTSILKDFFECTIFLPLNFERGDVCVRGYLRLIFFILLTPLSFIVLGLVYIFKKYKNTINIESSYRLWCILFLFSLIPFYKGPTPSYFICALFPFIILLARFWLEIISIFLNRKDIFLHFKSQFTKRIVMVLFIIILVFHSTT
ncbi:MAG: glycosyltransferase family 39 protein, partial [Candidatus Omnitrophica bacterium]|nr:glycosyltransferase family 39 protein [Candidatus Omnitrophota bacterium]